MYPQKSDRYFRRRYGSGLQLHRLMYGLHEKRFDFLHTWPQGSHKDAEALRRTKEFLCVLCGKKGLLQEVYFINPLSSPKKAILASVDSFIFHLDSLKQTLNEITVEKIPVCWMF